MSKIMSRSGQKFAKRFTRIFEVRRTRWATRLCEKRVQEVFKTKP